MSNVNLEPAIETVLLIRIIQLYGTVKLVRLDLLGRNTGRFPLYKAGKEELLSALVHDDITLPGQLFL